MAAPTRSGGGGAALEAPSRTHKKCKKKKKKINVPEREWGKAHRKRERKRAQVWAAARPSRRYGTASFDPVSDMLARCSQSVFVSVYLRPSACGIGPTGAYLGATQRTGEITSAAAAERPQRLARSSVRGRSFIDGSAARLARPTRRPRRPLAVRFSRTEESRSRRRVRRRCEEASLTCVTQCSVG